MKIGIYYDTLIAMGGAEKVVIQLANALGAEIVTSGYDPDKLMLKPHNVVHDLGNLSLKWSRPIGYLFEAPFRFFIFRNKYQYDLKIYVGYTSIYAVKKKDKSIWYCLTPNRILYDLREQKLSNQGIAGKLALAVHIFLFSWWDQSCARRFATIISQTKNIQRRVKRYYRLNSEVIYGPVDIKRFKQGKIGDYFLAVSRLFPEKRMTLIANAFSKRDDNLIMVGDGPEKAEISRLIRGNDNIKLLNGLSESELIELYENCRAVVYMPVDEDYGLVPIESMAAGKPCIAADEGGCIETILDKETGFLIKPNLGSLQRAVALVTPEWVSAHAKACRHQAEKFDLRNFTQSWQSIVESYGK